MDVRQLLEKKRLNYIPAGKDYKICCLNPDHDDTKPSLHIDTITGIYNCFVCGFKGNIFDYFSEQVNYLQIKKELFKRKIERKLAENIGLEIPTNAVPFNREWRGIRAETFAAFEAFEHSDPHHVGRVVFPIGSMSGKIVGFNGRSLTPSDTKYLITPAMAGLPLFPTKPEQIDRRVILVEGIFDMLNLHDKGLTNAVCAFGTKKVTKEKLNLLKIQGVTGIDVFFDGDEAGQKAAEEVKLLIESLELTSRNVCMTDTDPGALTAQKVLKIKERLYG